jgi:putative ABC transport system permease protein
LNAIFLRRGRWIDPSDPDEVIVSERSRCERLNPGDRVGAVINGRWRRLKIVGIGLSPEFIYEIRAVDLPGQATLRRAVDEPPRSARLRMEGGFNDVTLTAAHGANVKEVIARPIASWRSTAERALRSRAARVALVHLRRDRAESREQHDHAGDLLGVAAFLINIVLSRRCSCSAIRSR